MRLITFELSTAPAALASSTEYGICRLMSRAVSA
jgi:hypothetical protein